LGNPVMAEGHFTGLVSYIKLGMNFSMIIICFLSII